jgi:hypothetical protein
MEEDIVMNSRKTRLRGPTRTVQYLIAIVCAVFIFPGATMWAMQEQQPASQDTRISSEQLDSMVAPVALYPDPLLSQTLVASTYPLEIVQLQQWLGQNKGLKDKALADAVMKQNWDPSIQAMAQFPDLVKQLADNIAWTSELGNAFLAQQDDVMAAVQRLRARAKDQGALQSTQEQQVESKVVDGNTVIVVEPASEEVAYVPFYDPMTIWGSGVYPYPPIAYPAYPTGGRLLAFGVGVAIGSAWGHGGWGWNTGWGGGNNNININRNNTFVNNYNGQRANAGNRYGGTNNSWQHNPQHRGGTPYGNQATAQRFGGTASGAQRQTAARQGGGAQQAGASNFARNVGNAPTQSLNRGAGGGGGERIGNQQVSTGNMGSRNSSAFSGASTRSAAQASSSRGASSFGGGASRGGGGFRGGGGGRRR